MGKQRLFKWWLALLFTLACFIAYQVFDHHAALGPAVLGVVTNVSHALPIGANGTRSQAEQALDPRAADAVGERAPPVAEPLEEEAPATTRPRSATASPAEHSPDVRASSAVTSAAHGQAASLPSPWFLSDPAVDPPGFAAFRSGYLKQYQVGSKTAAAAKWIVFINGDGLGNWMLGATSAFLLAAMTGRLFAVLEPKADLCSWMESPLCEWTAALPANLKKEAKKRSRPNPPPEIEEKMDLLGVYWQGCSFRKLKCTNKYRGDVSEKQLVVVQSGAWFGDVLLMNPMYAPRLRAAFERVLEGGRRVVDMYGPLARWLYAPRPSVKREVDAYVDQRLRGPGRTSICVQGRHGTADEFKFAAKCIDALLAEAWWPRGTTTFHVASMREAFRKKLRKRYGAEVHWPDWDEDVSRQKDDVVAYQDMLLMGRCHIAVLPNGGSTFSYMPTAMYHSISLRDAGRANNLCRNLTSYQYEKLFPAPRQQLEKKCFEKGGPLSKPC